MKPIILSVGLLALLTPAGMAANSDTCTVNYEVQAINEVNIDGASVTLTVNTAVAGAEPTQASDSTTYDITTNCAANAKKLTGAINTAMPAGLTLQADVTAPTGGLSSGATTLTAVAADLVTAIDGVAEADLNLAFTLDATVAAGVLAAASKTFTLTLTDS